MKPLKTTAPDAERLVYADSSALVKLVVAEPESASLESYMAEGPILATSQIARVEVRRAVNLASPGPIAEGMAERILDSCLTVDVSEHVLEAAVDLCSKAVRTLDAIHLASALRIAADELLSYDRRLLDAASERGLAVSSPA